MTPRESFGDEPIGDAEVPRDLELGRSDAMPGQLGDWMARVEGKLDKLADDMAALNAMRVRVDEHHERLYGNGQPGIIKDVDRLKQWKQSLYWLVGILGGATAWGLISTLIGKK